MRFRSTQAGLSIIGFIVVAAMVMCFVMVGFRVAPAYIEYYSVEKALEQSLYDVRDFNSAAEVRAAFQKRADAGYIESVSGKDIEVVKNKNQITATATWSRKLHMVGNVSLFLDFEATATR